MDISVHMETPVNHAKETKETFNYELEREKK